LWGKEGVFENPPLSSPSPALTTLFEWYCYPTVTGHSSEITSLSSFIHSLPLLVSSSLDRTVRVFAPLILSTTNPKEKHGTTVVNEKIVKQTDFVSFIEIARPLIHGHSVYGAYIAGEGGVYGPRFIDPSLVDNVTYKTSQNVIETVINNRPKIYSLSLPVSICIASEEKPIRLLEGTRSFFNTYHASTLLPLPQSLLQLSKAEKAEASTQRLSNIPIYSSAVVAHEGGAVKEGDMSQQDLLKLEKIGYMGEGEDEGDEEKAEDDEGEKGEGGEEGGVKATINFSGGAGMSLNPPIMI
jgi:hypothetical protein